MELIVVILIAGVVSGALLGLYAGLHRTTADQQVRVLNQDSARLALYEMTRYIRAACSSDSNVTSASDSIAVAGPQELVFFVDLDGDGNAERARYYLSNKTLRMQTAKPNTSVTPHTYPAGYSSDSIVILSGVVNGSSPVFTYYGYNDKTNELYPIANPNTEGLRRDIVTIGISLAVNEKPEIAKGPVQLSTQVLVRQRYDGGINATSGI